MGKPRQTVYFQVAKADVSVLLGDLDEHEPSALFAHVFKQLSAAAANPIQPDTAEIEIDEAHAEAFREWLQRARLRHAKNGDPVKARAFARVRRRED
jgi:hypothetical protein